jgi:hypothetical protein
MAQTTPYSQFCEYVMRTAQLSYDESVVVLNVYTRLGLVRFTGGGFVCAGESQRPTLLRGALELGRAA